MSQKNTVAHSLTKLLLTGLFGLLAHSSSAQTAAAPAPALTASDAPTKGLLFEIKSGKQTAYLFGSIHIAKADFSPMSPKVEAAYKQSDVLAVEIDTSNAAAVQAVMPKLLYAAPDNLEKHLTPATWTLVKNIAGPNAEQLQMLKPGMVASSVMMGAASVKGYSPEHGIDMHFIKRAKTDAKALFELESLEFQVNMLAGLTDEEGDSMVAALFKSFGDKTFFNELDGLAAVWKSGDAEALAQKMLESANKDAGTKKFSKLMFDDRNEGMTLKIKKLMSDGKKPFIVVGAGHLAGAMSIVDLLKKQGLQVTQIR
jgi:uncharacterized protein YbaP (TraB family)